MLTARRYIWGKTPSSTDDVEMSEALESNHTEDEDRAELVRFTVLCLHIKC
jgi:hypothetical protein